jgi:hypothetical protein
MDLADWRDWPVRPARRFVGKPGKVLATVNLRPTYAVADEEEQEHEEARKPKAGRGKRKGQPVLPGTGYAGSQSFLGSQDLTSQAQTRVGPAGHRQSATQNPLSASLAAS